MKIAILGFGREGKSVLKFLQKTKKYPTASIEIRDKNRSKNYLKNLGQFDLIFRSPGIPWNLPELKRARKRGVVFGSATQIFLDRCPATIIGVTGTKGKGTTATLIYKMLKASGKKAYLAGNIGLPALEILPKLKKNDLVVLELSSFQLQDVNTSPRIAVVLEVFPDHQDSHKTLREYYNAKANIAKYQRPVDNIFFFGDQMMSTWVARKSSGKKISVLPNKFRPFRRDAVKMPGEKNYRNAVMAATVAKTLGVSLKTIQRVLKTFPGNEHRLEFVRNIRGTAFYNDSASTNPQTSAAAVKAFPNNPKILLAGGQDKGLDYKPLTQALRRSGIKLVVLYGENKNKIRRAIASSKIPIRSTTTLKSALSIAYKNTAPSDVVLFSPGAASFDQFENYADRGETFKRLVKTLRPAQGKNLASR